MTHFPTYKVYLDDVRTPIDKSWIIVRSYSEFVNWFFDNFNLPFEEPMKINVLISFDHDLGVEYHHEDLPFGDEEILYNEYKKELTGCHCAKWLVSQNIIITDYRIHSVNVVGAQNILLYLQSWNNFNEVVDNGKICIEPYYI